MNKFLLPLMLFLSFAGRAYSDSGVSRRSTTTFDVKKELERLLESVAVSRPSSIITLTEWSELHLDTFLGQIDTTKTAFGSWALRKLMCPTDDLVSIKQMQQVLKLLYEDERVYQDLKRGIACIADQEQVLIDYYNPICLLHSAAQTLYYDSFFKDQLNNSKHALDGALFIDVGRSLLACGGSLIVGGLMELGPRYLFNTSSDKQKSNQTSFLNTLVQRYNPGHHLLKDPDLLKTCNESGNARFNVWSQGSLGDSYLVTIMEIQQRCREWSTKTSWGMAHFSAALLSAFLFFKAVGHDLLAIDTIKKSYRRSITIWTTRKQLCSAITELVTLFQDINTLTSFVKVHRQCAPLPLREQLDLFEANGSPTLQDFLAQVYAADVSKLSYGQILLLHKKMREIKDELVPLLQVIGFIDALLAIVDLIKTYEANDLPICFVEFIDHPSASLQADNFWLPLLQAPPVPNSILLGSGGPNKVVLTGPNGGGKSTVMKSLCYLVLLGQSWGIAPASGVLMTLFNGLTTSFYPQDDIAHELSTFMAEKKRMESIQKMIDTCMPHSKLLIALDEPYRGTIEAESAKRVFSFGNELADKSNIGLLLATHLELPTHLDCHRSAFVNYQLEYLEDKHKTSSQFKRTFKLLPGPASWWFEDAQKRAAFIEDL